MRSTNPREVALIFRDYARQIHHKAKPQDPNFLRISVMCSKVISPTRFVGPVRGNSRCPLDRGVVRAKLPFLCHIGTGRRHIRPRGQTNGRIQIGRKARLHEALPQCSAATTRTVPLGIGDLRRWCVRGSHPFECRYRLYHSEGVWVAALWMLTVWFAARAASWHIVILLTFF
jgi:hypothetical protein